MCVGPHLTYTKALKAFKLTAISGAYWKNDQKNKMLTRLNGVAFRNADELKELQVRMLPYLEVAAQKQQVSMIFFMLTSIMDEGTTLLCYGKNHEKLVSVAFDRDPLNGVIELPGVVSRKKQLIPMLTELLAGAAD